MGVLRADLQVGLQVGVLVERDEVALQIVKGLV